MIGFPTKPDE